MKKHIVFSSWLVLLTCITWSVHAASPGMNNADLFDGILQRFATVASSWGLKMVDFGTWLFWGLSLISMVWTFGFMALRKADIGELLAEAIRFFVSTGFFLWILTNGPAMAIAIIDSMRQIASKASGVGYALSPSGIMDVGFDIFFKVVDSSSIWSPANTTVGLLVATIILIVLTLVAIQLLLILISVWLIAYGGVFLLGFGGGRWTQDIAINYYKTVLSIGVQILAMILIVGVGKSFIDQFYAVINTDISIKDLAIMLVVSLILYLLVKSLPPMLAGIVHGGGNGGGGGMGLGSVMGGAAMAAAAASSLGASAADAAANVAGGAQALKAAFQAAQQSMGNVSSSGSGSSDGSGGGLGGGLASAMGNAGRMAMSMGQHLASGAGELAKERMSSVKESAQDKIAGTAGGKIAQVINNKSAVSQATEQSDSVSMGSQHSMNDLFNGDSLGAGRGSQVAGEKSMHQQDEVAQFVNKFASVDKGE